MEECIVLHTLECTRDPDHLICCDRLGSEPGIGWGVTSYPTRRTRCARCRLLPPSSSCGSHNLVPCSKLQRCVCEIRILCSSALQTSWKRGMCSSISLRPTPIVLLPLHRHLGSPTTPGRLHQAAPFQVTGAPRPCALARSPTKVPRSRSPGN